MRELDRVKDKIEIRLDPRQVMTLGVATTVFCGVLFGAGFWAGRRQARVPANEPANLAALDAASRAVRDEGRSTIPSPALGDVEFLFPAVVAAGPGRGPEQTPIRVPAVIVQPYADGLSDAHVVVAANAPRAAPEPFRPAPEPFRPPPEPVRVAAEPVRVVAPPVIKPVERAPIVETPIAAFPEPKPAAVPPPSAVPPPPDEVDAAPKAAVALPAPPDEDEPGKAEARAAGSSNGGQKSGYTLQVKAARDKDEADAVAEKLRKAGFEPSLIVADVPGKGRYYRVRVGRFENVEEAREFQRKLKARSGLSDAGFVTDL